MSVLARVRRTIRQHGLAHPETRVVAAVSGGSDSVALLHLLMELAHAGDLCLAGVAHFNHQLRAAADAEEQFVADLASRLGCRLLADREDVRARAARERQSVEHAARDARLSFLERARVAFGADVVAVGHTRDDQAETFLLRLVRGAGARGLAAMHPASGAIVRPLIDCRRAELREYLNERQLDFVEDESNRDTAIPRNRVRAELIPLLASRFNPAVVDALADAAAVTRDEWAWMQQESDRLLAAAVRRDTAEASVEVVALARAPLALRRLAMWRLMTSVAHGRTIAFTHVETALRLLEHPSDGQIVDAPGVRLERRGGCVVLTGRSSATRGRPVRRPVNLFEYPLSIPGEAVIHELGVAVSAELSPRATLGELQDVSAVVRSDVPQPLAVRNRRPGDRFRPGGSGGRKKLQDYFVDRKVPRSARDRVPIVVDARDRIVWVAGYAIDRDFDVPEAAQSVLLLRLKLLGGSV